MIAVRAIILAAFVVGFTAPAYAACLDPVADPGKIVFNEQFDVFQGCTAHGWVAVLGARGPAGPPGDAAIPAGAVMSFNLAECPDGWSEYAPAYGRFVRGIDRSGAGTDPDGERSAGSPQLDAMQQITGTISTPNTRAISADGAFSSLGTGSSQRQSGSQGGGRIGFDSADSPGARVADETRPVNVALLYCEKD